MELISHKNFKSSVIVKRTKLTLCSLSDSRVIINYLKVTLKISEEFLFVILFRFLFFVTVSVMLAISCRRGVTSANSV